MDGMTIRFSANPFPTPEEVAETMANLGAGEIGTIQYVKIDSSQGVSSTGTYPHLCQSDPGDETDEREPDSPTYVDY